MVVIRDTPEQAHEPRHKHGHKQQRRRRSAASARRKVTLRDILNEHYDGFAQTHPLSPDMKYAAARLRKCRTAALGGHVVSCPQGCLDRIAYNSCHHRSCPECALLDRERWLAGWKARLLNCPHQHCVFTVPHELLPVWRYNKRWFAGALFRAASQSLLELLRDERHLGAFVGLLAALHTWSQTLAEHVHLHVVVTCGGLDASGRWRAVKKSCLLPRKVLMVLFRGKLRGELLQALAAGNLVLPPETTAPQLRGLLNKLGRTDWHVKIMERYEHGHGVVTYLARYLKGGPIGNSRLLSLQDGQVTFRYRHGSDGEGGRGRQAELTLPVETFLSRLLEHVPPRGLHTVRGFGLYAGCHRELLNAARALCGQAAVPRKIRRPTCRELLMRLGHGDPTRCPVCGAELVSHSPFARGRSPPPPYDRLTRSGAEA